MSTDTRPEVSTTTVAPDSLERGPREVGHGSSGGDHGQDRSPAKQGGQDRPPAAKKAGAAQDGWVIPLAVLIAGMFMSVLDTSIVNVAIRSIQRDFGGSTSDVAWISTAYSLVLGVVVPASAWLGDRYGLGRVYISALTAFAIGSALCGIAWNLDSLIAFRVLQGIPGGLLPAVSLTMVYRLVPPAKIGTAMGMYGLGIVFAPAIGPALGGYLVEYVNWRLVFYINVPIGVLGLVAALLWLPKFPTAKSYRFDVVGFLTAAVGLTALLLAFSEGESWGWTGYRVLILITVGVLSLATFVVVELEVEHPLLDLRVFRHRTYVVSLLAMSVMMTGLFATLFYVPLFLQEGQGYQAFYAGMLILPQALVMAVLTPLTGRLYDKIGPRYLALTGLLIAALGSYLLAGINVDMTRPELVLWTCVRSLGVGLAMMPIMTGGLSSVPPALTTSASALNTVAQRVSAALGLAGLTALATTQQADLRSGRGDLLTGAAVAHLKPGELSAVMQRVQLDALAQSYSNVFLFTAVLTLVAAGLSLMLRAGPSQGSSSTATTE